MSDGETKDVPTRCSASIKFIISTCLNVTLLSSQCCSKMVNTYKVVLCGKTGVGKTSIFRRMCGRTDLDCQQTVAKTTVNHECKIVTDVEGKAVEVGSNELLPFIPIFQVTHFY